MMSFDELITLIIYKYIFIVSYILAENIYFKDLILNS
jgi:hypothetical protein